jgi:hypothetical protein
MSLGLTRTARLASWILPPRDREIILADLWEESAGERRRGRWVARQAVRMAMHFHLECYRDPGDSARLLALLLCGAGLVTTIHAISLGPMDGARFFADPITRAILAFWSASHITSALAAGLVTGRMTLASHLSVARWHIVALLAVMLVAQHGLALGTVGAILLAGSAALADRARRAADDTANRPTLAPQ